MPRSTQPLLHAAFRPRNEHGGSIRSGRRKLARPIDPKRPLRIVPKSDRAERELSFLRPAHARPIRLLLLGLCRRYEVRLI